MSTIKATKYYDVKNVSDLVEAIERHGKENVSTDDMYGFLSTAAASKIVPEEWQKLIMIASDTIVANTITSVFSYDSLIDPFATAFNTSVDDLIAQLVEIALDRNLELHRLHTRTTIEQLNALADKGLAPLYFVETVESIDTAFVRKYANELDLEALSRCTKNDEVRELVEELENN